MSRFLEELADAQPVAEPRRWLYVPYDQLTDAVGPLAEATPEEVGIVMVESAWKASLRPYHVQKLALVLTNQRHFALEQARRGFAVRYVISDLPYAEALRPVAEEVGRLSSMEPAEWELRRELRPVVQTGLLEIVPHAGWLTEREDFLESGGDTPPWRMDAFYRHVRRRTGWLMKDGKPVGGKFSFDAENRKPWNGDPAPPEVPRFEPDPITREVGEIVQTRFAAHPGELDLSTLPASADDASRLWQWALAECLEHFGPYEDAMSTRSGGLFHTRISSLVNISRLLPARVVRDVSESEAPLASREGFVRQVLGWREFVRHVHRETEGFRSLAGGGLAGGGTAAPPAHTPGDGGWSHWRGSDWAEESPTGSVSITSPRDSVDGGARPSALGAEQPLPAAFWGEESGLACLDHVVAEVWETGYSHHITRLMVLANLATLLDVSPREITDWFWVAYTDAYDWVVEPNVLGMGTFAAGGLMTTKPYVSGAAYIDRMSDYCTGCRFDPKKNCPITRLYWSFLGRNEEKLAENPRMRLQLASLRKRAPRERKRDEIVLRIVQDRLGSGETLSPADLQSIDSEAVDAGAGERTATSG